MPGYFDDVRYGPGAGDYGVGFGEDARRDRFEERFGMPFPEIPQRPVNPQVTPPRLGPTMRILGGRGVPDMPLGATPAQPITPIAGGGRGGGALPGQGPVKGSSPRVGGVLPANQPTPVVAPTLAPTKKKSPYFGPPRPGFQGSL